MVAFRREMDRRIVRGYLNEGKGKAVRKSCFVLNFFIYSFNFYSPFAVFSSYWANSHFPLYLLILSYDHRQTNEKRIHWTAQHYCNNTSLYPA
jgi:hypothetical protein